MTDRKTIEIALLMYPDCLLSAIYGLTDLFRIANLVLESHPATQRAPIRVTHWRYETDAKGGAEIHCVHDTHPGTAHDPVAVVLPPSMVEPSEAQSPEKLKAWLKEKHDNGAIMCSACAGSFLLGAAGMLDGRPATTHWMFTESMARRFPKVNVDTDKMVIDDNDIVTAGGIMAWTDLGLRLVHRLHGPTLMMETARVLLIDPPGREQRFYIPFTPNLHHGDPQILKVQHWLQKTGARDVDMASMAEYAGMGERTFLRRFQKATGMKPTEYCQHVRVAKAREMLEFTHQNVDQIAWSVGYEDPGAFRKVFHKITGLAPGDYRVRFGMAA